MEVIFDVMRFLLIFGLGFIFGWVGGWIEARKSHK